MRYPITIALLIPIIALLEGCQIAASSAAGGPWYNSIPIGASLELLRPLSIAPGRATVGIRRSGLDAAAGEYAPNCKLEVFNLSDERVVVEPDTFIITKVTGGYTSILAARPRPIVVAGINSSQLRLSLGGGDDGSSFLKSYAQLFLTSPRQPNVYRLDCSYIGDPWDVELLTIAEIRQALGETFVLDLVPR